MGIAWALAAAVLAGMAQATQAVYNTAIARSIGTLPSALISMSVAAVILLAVCLVRQVPLPSLSNLGAIAPYPLLVGGACGAIILSCVLFALPQLGSAGVIVLFILGQLVAAVLLDHFAVLGITRHAISLPRLAGVGAVLLGAFLIVRG